MADLAAPLADHVVVLVVAHGLVVGAVAAEVGPEQETVVDEDLERPVDGGRVDAR